jgi:hypothetical protein
MSLSMPNGRSRSSNSNSRVSISIMYRDFLKEIGAEESNTMDYLFGESSEEEGDDNDENENEDHDEDDTIPYNVGEKPSITTAAATTTSIVANSARRFRLFSPDNSTTTSSTTSDQELLQLWESKVEDNGNTVVDDDDLHHHQQYHEDEDHVDHDEEVKVTSTIAVPKDGETNSSSHQVEWREKLHQATIHQEHLMLQMMKLQNNQKASSPIKHKRENFVATKVDTKEGTYTPMVEQKETTARQGILLQDLVVGSPILLQEVSFRNDKLHQEWQSQQRQTVELQQKLNHLQSQFHYQQHQWQKESQQLFSPILSRTTNTTKIPRWDPTTPDAKIVSTSEAVSTAPKSVEDKNENKIIPELAVSSLSWLLQQKDERIRELEAQLDKSQRVQAEQKEELHTTREYRNKRDAEYQALLFQYEKDKKVWEDLKKEWQSHHQKEKEALIQQLDAANDLVQKQVTVNQQQREELQNFKTKTWNSELEETQNQIKIAIAQQKEKTKEFHQRIHELECRHEEERQSWSSQLEGYKTHIEENDADWECRLDKAQQRYAELESRYCKETQEWQDLLESCMTNTIEESEGGKEIFRFTSKEKHKCNVGFLSPIPHETSILLESTNNQLNNNETSVPIETVPSLSMENTIDNLMDELGKMDAERTAILEEIHRQDLTGVRQVNISQPTALEKSAWCCQNGSISDTKTQVCPLPVDTPQSSPRIRPAHDSSPNVLDTTSDSLVLDQTLTLLYNLKELMTCNGDMNEREASVLEQLEVLSELMQDQSSYQQMPDQSSYQSLLSSPKRGETIPEATSLDISRDDDYKAMWISGVQAAIDPWPALVSELTSRCEFLEQDRRDLARITEDILRNERESHRVMMQAAVATANREANQKLNELTQEHHHSIRIVYQSLCYRCQQGVYSMLGGEKAGCGK